MPTAHVICVDALLWADPDIAGHTGFVTIEHAQHRWLSISQGYWHCLRKLAARLRKPRLTTNGLQCWPAADAVCARQALSNRAYVAFEIGVVAGTVWLD